MKAIAHTRKDGIKRTRAQAGEPLVHGTRKSTTYNLNVIAVRVSYVTAKGKADHGICVHKAHAEEEYIILLLVRGVFEVQVPASHQKEPGANKKNSQVRKTN